MHYPQSSESMEALARRVAEVHADAVNQHLKSLTCPDKQKLLLLDAVVKTVKDKNRGRSC